MAFMIKEIIDLKGILLLMLLTIPSEATNLDCYGKAFHCVNSTHFMICVDLGTGISTTIDDVVIPCPTPTVCRPTNRFECEFLPASTSVPLEVSTIANIVTSPVSEFTTFIPLDTTSIPFEEYFNTLSPTTMSQNVHQTTESPLTVQLSISTRISDITSPSKSIFENTDESVAREASAKPGNAIDTSTDSGTIQNNANNSYVEQIHNTILNLDVIPYKAEVTIINNQEVATVTDTLTTQGADSPIINAQHNYLGDVTSTSTITEQTKITEELFTPNFQDLSVNAIIPEHLSIASTVDPTTQIEEMVSVSESTRNEITFEPASFTAGSTNNETTTDIVSTNDVKRKDLNSFYIINTTSGQNDAPRAISISDQLNVSNNNMKHEAVTYIAITETTTDDVPNDGYYEEPSGSTPASVHVSFHHNNMSSVSGSEVTTKYTKEVRAIVNVSESNTELSINNMNKSESSTTETYAFFSDLNISHKRNNATMDENKEDFSTDAVAQEPVTEYLSSSTDGKNLENLVPFNVELATINSESLMQDIVTSSINLLINPNTAYYNDNLETLANPSTTVMTGLDLVTENVNDVLQSDTENIGVDFNNTIGNTTDGLKLNEKVISTKYENSKISTPVFKLDSNSETSTHSTYDLEQAHEFSKMSDPPFLEETTQSVIAKDDNNVTTDNMNLYSLNKTYLQTETTTSSAFATLSTTFNFSPIPANETNIVTATEIINQINGSINIAQDADNFKFKYKQIVTTNKPSKDTDIVSTNEPTNKMIHLDQNKLAVTALGMINKLSTKTDTVKSYNSFSTENFESLSQSNTIPKDSSILLPTTEVKSIEASLEKSQGDTITYETNVKTRTETDMSPQSTTSDIDSLYKTSLKTENIILPSLLSISPINAADTISTVGIKNEIYGINTASNVGDKIFMNVQSVTTNKLSKQSDSLPTVKGHTDKMIPLEQNAFTGDAYEIDKSSTITATMDPNNIIVKDRLLLTKTIPMDTAKLLTTKIRNIENYPGETIPNNINDITMTGIDMPLQSTLSDLSQPTVDSISVSSVESTKVFNNREHDMLIDRINNHTVPDSIITPITISSELYYTSTVGDEANMYGTNVWNSNENKPKAYSLNKAIDDTIDRSILAENITSTSTTYPFTVRALLLAEGSDMPTVDIVKNNESSLTDHVVPSSLSPETVQLTQKSITADKGKNIKGTNKTSIQTIFQWTSPTTATDTVYDVSMTDSTIAAQLTDNDNIMIHGSNSVVEMLLSNAITQATTANSDMNKNTVRNSVDHSVNVKGSKVKTSVPNSISEVYSQEPSTSKPVLLNNSIQKLAQSTQIITTTDTTKHNTDVSFKSPVNTLFTQNNSTMSTKEETLMMRSTDSPIPGENIFNKIPEQVFVTSSYADPVFSSLENVANNSSRLTIQHQESILSIDNPDLSKTSLDDKHEEVIAGITLSKFAKTSLEENKRSNIINTELNYTTSNVSNEINNYRQPDMNPPLELISRITNSIKNTAASNNSIPVIHSTEKKIVPTHANNEPNQESLSEIRAEQKENNNLYTDINTKPFMSDDQNLITTISNDGSERSYISQTKNKSNIIKIVFTPVPFNLSIGGIYLSTANKSSSLNYKYPLVTQKIELLEKPKGSIVTSTPSPSSMQTENTIDKNKIALFTQPILSSVNPNISVQFLKEPIESELLHKIVVTERSKKQSLQKNDIPKTTHFPYDETTQSTGNELTAQAAPFKNFSNIPVPLRSGTTTKPHVAIDLPSTVINLDISKMKSDTTESGDLLKFKAVYTAQNVNTVDSSTLADQLPLSGTNMSSKTVNNKIESLEISTSTNTIVIADTNQVGSKTSKDTVNTPITSTNLVQENFSKRTDDSLLFINNLKTDNNVSVTTGFTSNIELGPETWKREINTNDNSNKLSKGRTTSILQKTSVINDTVDNATPTILSSNLSGTVVATNVISSTDFFVNTNMESQKTHSGIISLLTPSTNQVVTKEKEEKSDNEASKVKKSGTSSYLDQKLAPVSNSSYIPSFTSASLVNNKKQRHNSTQGELLIQTRINHFKPTNGISREALHSTDMNKTIFTSTINAGSKINNEPLTRETIDNSTTPTNGSHTSISKSKDQNNKLFVYNTTVISNDQSGTPHYMSYTKSTAVGDVQTTELPAFEFTRKSESNFTCKQKIRGKYADELNCRKFYICLGNSHIFEGICPVNTVFSEIRKQCTKNLSHCIRNNQFRCVAEGRFGDFLNDNVYYICAKNNVSSFIRFKLRCQNGYHLNKTSVRCVLNNESQQSSSSSDSSKNSSDQSASSASKQDKETSGKKFKCKKEGIFADPSDCRRYFECKKSDNSEYKQKRKKCGNDETFNRDKKKCVDDDSYECK